MLLGGEWDWDVHVLSVVCECVESTSERVLRAIEHLLRLGHHLIDLVPIHDPSLPAVDKKRTPHEDQQQEQITTGEQHLLRSFWPNLLGLPPRMTVVMTERQYGDGDGAGAGGEYDLTPDPLLQL
eukprot:CAMPEP_0173303790 /NCGR_PEP_ID=MMETSP1143-20121109/19092_1 /TAXON_ID=483371 /ORGANISM="non described non described, Strain CCMP2298" /LENGTH=124 /DNA_ID=CAMNT_0014244553 /DNA_START=1244 /DNA_END=1619 /DNA_ORIENTATION=-